MVQANTAAELAAEAAWLPPTETHAMTHTEVQMCVVPYAELCRRPALFTELRQRVIDLKAQPSKLMALLQPPSNGKLPGPKSASAPSEAPVHAVAPPKRSIIAALGDPKRPTGGMVSGSRPQSRAHAAPAMAEHPPETAAEPTDAADEQVEEVATREPLVIPHNTPYRLRAVPASHAIEEGDEDFPLLTPMLVMSFEIFKAQGSIGKNVKPWRDKAMGHARLIEFKPAKGHM